MTYKPRRRSKLARGTSPFGSTHQLANPSLGQWQARAGFHFCILRSAKHCPVSLKLKEFESHKQEKVGLAPGYRRFGIRP
ncbi:MAG: hypothetical protein ACE5HL_13110 [Terriglobia bacterium]